MRRELKAKAVEEGVEPCYTCGPYEILRISYEACKYIEEKSAKDGLLLKAMRRSAFLHWRPSLSTGGFVPSDSQSWAKDLSEGGHRFPNGWLSCRSDWLVDGEPIEPKWAQGCGAGVEAIEHMEDPEQHGPEGSVVKLKCCSEAVEQPGLTFDVEEERLELNGGVEFVAIG